MGTPGRQVLGARSWGIAFVAAVLALGLLLSWNAGREHGAAAAVPAPDASIAGTPVVAGDGRCGDGWTGGTAGTLDLAIWNDSNNPVEVYLQDVRTRKVYLDVENLGTGATRAATVTLGPGSYELVCLPSEGPPVHGAAQQVTGSAPAHVTAGVVPLTETDLEPAVARYQAWVRRQLPGLVADTRRLAADVRAGDLAAAKRDWLLAHTRYETLGAAYGAFGDDDTAINALPRSYGDATRDRHLHGFHRIEAMLWSGRTAGVVGEADALVRAVRHLRDDVRTQHVIQPIDVGLRAHEILEDSIGHVLTGADDADSHTGLATIDANLTGTWHALRPLLGLLRTRDPQLVATERWLRRDRRLVASHHHGARWTPLSRLTRAQRERLDAAFTETVELLSRVAVITDPRRGAQ